MSALQSFERTEDAGFAASIGQGSVGLLSLLADSERLRTLEPDFARIDLASAGRRRLAVVRTEGQLALLTPRPGDFVLRSWAYVQQPQACGRVIETSEEAFDEWMAWCEQSQAALGGRRSGQEGARQATSPGAGSGDDLSEEISLAGIGAQSNEVIRFVSSVLFDSLKAGASDIHLEADPRGLDAKIRLDGVLCPLTRLDGVSEAGKVVSRIKVLSGLDIAERRIPQDGRLSVRYRQRAIDVRVSIMPSVHGEDVVLRILDREHLAQRLQGLTLAKLGFEEDLVQRFKRLCARPYGMVLVTGPTGSGKTTSLYAALTETRNPQEKVITIEDPVEYQLDGVLQIPVNERKGLTFAKGLRSILRHDPDRILVGEIRDQETAQIAVQSALTGHVVYTTVHANNAFDVLSRFTQLAIDPYDLAAALNGVLAQRLIRLVCPDCCQPASVNPQTLKSHGVQIEGHPTGKWVRAAGCRACRGSGYRGRRAIGELLMVTPEVKALLARRASQSELLATTAQDGFVSLRAVALRLAACGETTLAEVDRVTLAQ